MWLVLCTMLVMLGLFGCITPKKNTTKAGDILNDSCDPELNHLFANSKTCYPSTATKEETKFQR